MNTNCDYMNINVLRLDHRVKRDVRITTHVCLTARAFGASKIYLSGEEDEKLMKNVEDVVTRWGGSFEIAYKKNYMNLIDEWQNNGGEVIHLTMYGSQVQNVVEEIKSSEKDKLIVVGGSRVPTKIYKKSDWNVSVTNQPHSEVSSLAVFQHMIMDGEEFNLDFNDAIFEVVPVAEGKQVNIHENNEKINDF
ncbi:tRNA 2'-O-methylase [Methanobrevibacter cuticularis]|uniref:tRNA (cytidine(56)-2'-O)-methyltransferase n=2 Tax=Methanobrevibacter cuticularis TaxID=47311 RepID=A0A166F3M0_9EURY|nr:tRNA 2'-O-methylase [Methanobrevibacter cuticularis]